MIELTEDDKVALIEARSAGTDVLIRTVEQMVNDYALEAVVMESIAADPLTWEQRDTP